MTRLLTNIVVFVVAVARLFRIAHSETEGWGRARRGQILDFAFLAASGGFLGGFFFWWGGGGEKWNRTVVRRTAVIGGMWLFSRYGLRIRGTVLAELGPDCGFSAMG